jgi:hypothetical protein
MKVWQDPKWLAPTKTTSAPESVELVAHPAYEPETVSAPSREEKGEKGDAMHAT